MPGIVLMVVGALDGDVPTTQAYWTQLNANISDAAGGTIQFRWTLDTDGSVTYYGIYVDEIRIKNK